ncbi:MAG TPA: hypothetical protein VGK59_15280 [Ohtaekwangia sp.]
MKSIYAILFLTTLVWACNNIEDAEPAAKNTFIKFYHGPYSYTSVEVERIPDGYAVLGNMTISDDSVVATLIRTDENGNPAGEIQYYPGCTAKSLQVLQNGDQVSGYVILGDSIKVDPNASKVGNILVYATRILLVNTSGTIQSTRTYRDDSQDTSRVLIDYRGNTLTTNENNELIILGNYREDLSRPEKSFVVALDFNLNQQWYKTYDLIDVGQTDYNYVNAKSIHAKQGNLIWASSILKSTGEFSDSYLAIPFVEAESTFKNFSMMGETSSQLFYATDIKPSNGPGYGVVGTRASTDGSNANMFFARVDGFGNFVAESTRYFDGVLSQQNEAIDFTASESQDTGESITSTPDGGFVLAGSTKIGSNSTDIFLIKVNSSGDILWNKILGGSGEETISSIISDSDGNLTISGTNNLGGLSSIFLMKTDSKGELKN